MKTTAFVIMAITIFCCCKKGGKNIDSQNERLIDKWELRESVGGIANQVNYPPGNGYIFDFKSDNSFVQYGNSNIVRSGTYDLQPTSRNDSFQITFHTNLSDLSQGTILKGDTLVLLKTETCCDMPDFIYVRTSK